MKLQEITINDVGLTMLIGRVEEIEDVEAQQFIIDGHQGYDLGLRTVVFNS